MKQIVLNFFIVVLMCLNSHAQFAPPAGQIGSTAIPADSNCFISWASQCTIYRGHVNISDPSFEYNESAYASYGEENWAVGQADNQVLSLGDSGIAILEFNPPIANGIGWDFAVFENALNDSFLEFAFVEVSSDGINYFRFPATSLTQTQTQTPGFGATDATKINNLAGKYRVLFGTPFNLDEITENELLHKNNIRFVKIIDVIGSINPPFATTDSHGNIINESWPTPFNSCGFDLDAIGVINNSENTFIKEEFSTNISIYPNPVSNSFMFLNSDSEIQEATIYSLNGQLLHAESIKSCFGSINIENLPSGTYFVKLLFKNNSITKLLIIP